ncbi:MAG: hypothetical protein GQ557_02445 [Mycoplasmataceae bacterium]|nr:hypothetical protein [Mycoplasmataceae bacterium]
MNDNENPKKINFTIEYKNKDLMRTFVKKINPPLFILDFEAITFLPKWMHENNLDLDQQIFSFSFLKISDFNDEKEIPFHFNFIKIGMNHKNNYEVDYKKMAKELANKYRQFQNSPVYVWSSELEYKAIIKLLRNSDQKDKLVLTNLLINIIDLQVYFRSKNDPIIEIVPVHKSSLSWISNAFGIKIESKLRNGQRTNYLLRNIINNKNISLENLNEQCEKLEEYNNSDVIKIKRILIKIHKDLV